MGIRNKACIMVTLGAAFGIKDHMNMIKSNSCALINTEWTVMVSYTLLAKLFSGDFGGSKELLIRTGNQERKRAEESWKMVVYLSCWGPN
ncbi:hypothetical protein LWI28_010732 [Acer negundo]|uniref:Uncharacterized protein n=1 Tax=Acer negundo TaxID=4023 RepID=A0AAD5J5Q0_ACENE|nr:hypothetical protein LWI28_010732 [Acer negundo]